MGDFILQKVSILHIKPKFPLRINRPLSTMMEILTKTASAATDCRLSSIFLIFLFSFPFLISLLFPHITPHLSHSASFSYISPPPYVHTLFYFFILTYLPPSIIPLSFLLPSLNPSHFLRHSNSPSSALLQPPTLASLHPPSLALASASHCLFSLPTFPP